MVTLPAIRPGPTKTIFLDIVAHPHSTAGEIAERTGLDKSLVVHAMSYLEVNRYVGKHRVGPPIRGNSAKWFATAEEAEPDTWPEGLARELPAVPAALPVDRSLRPHVGVVMLLDQQRQVA